MASRTQVGRLTGVTLLIEVNSDSSSLFQAHLHSSLSDSGFRWRLFGNCCFVGENGFVEDVEEECSFVARAEQEGAALNVKREIFI